MNYAAVKDAISQCERYERYVKVLGDLDKKSARIIQDNTATATYLLLKTLMGAGPAWDSQEFGVYLLPADILAEAIHKANERVADAVAESLEQARKIVEEGFAVDNIGKKKSKAE